MASIGSKKIALEISVNWLYGIGVLAIALIAAFIFVPVDWRPTLIFGTAVVAGAAALTTAINNLDQRVVQTQKAAELAQAARVAAALEFLYRWNDPTFFHCKKAGRDMTEEFRKTTKLEDRIAYLKSDMTRYANLFDVLNVFEALNIAIDNSVVDSDTSKRFFRSIVIEYWHLAGPIIENVRAERNNTRLYKEFENLYRRWKD